MLFFRYELYWKDYDVEKSIEYIAKKKYDLLSMKDMNESFYHDYLKEKEYVIQIANRKDSKIVVYVATSMNSLENALYEKEIQRVFHDCEIVSCREVTIDEYKKSIEEYSHQSLLKELRLDYKETNMMPYPFTLEEKILDEALIHKIGGTIDRCKKRAKEMICTRSLSDEIERIYSDDNQKKYYGHPVHYWIESGDWRAAKDIYKLIVSALITNKRLVSNRIVVIRDLSYQVCKDGRYAQVISAAEGGTVIIELDGRGETGPFATGYQDIIEYTGIIFEKKKQDTLFIFVDTSMTEEDNKEVFDKILSKGDIIHIDEGIATLNQAQEYLLRMVEEIEYITNDKSDVLEYLPNEDFVSVKDIHRAYQEWYKSGLKNHIYKAYKDINRVKIEVADVENVPYDELQEMVGLSEVKNLVDQIIAMGKMKRIRDNMGLRTDAMSLHMMFSGNPGTAKTTVARLLSKILKQEGVIKTGRFVECGRQDLVGKYVGWTAKIVEKKFNSARGGILFIDEAYALVDDSNTYGAEAINCITHLMEKYRDEVIVIFAGYPEKMKIFMEQNEGLRSRIGFYLFFPDYSSEELVQILLLHAKKMDYNIDLSALDFCRELFEKARYVENFGNGRFVRNVLENAILRQSCRLLENFSENQMTKEELCCLKSDDFAKILQMK